MNCYSFHEKMLEVERSKIMCLGAKINAFIPNWCCTFKFNNRVVYTTMPQPLPVEYQIKMAIIKIKF